MNLAAAQRPPAWHEPDDGKRWLASTGLALLIEVVVLVAMAWWVSRPAPPPPPQPVEITLTQPKPQPKVVTPKPPPPKPKPPKPKPKPLPRPKVRHIVHPKPLPLPPKPRIQPPPAPVPAARPAMPVAPPPPPPPPPRKPPKVDTAALQMSFEVLMREAIQDAVHYPEAARLMQVEGRTQVAFTFLDGRVSQLRVVHSSGVPSLDRAALQAVRTAPYPAPPAALAGRPLAFVVWVRFRLSDN